MSRDSSRTYLHLHAAHHADIFEDFTRPLTTTHTYPPSTAPFSIPPSTSGRGGSLPPDTIYVPPQHQPPNPEDEDDVVPDQHAAFGIQQATQRKREAEWRDLGLDGLMRGGGLANGGAGAGSIATGFAGGAGGAAGAAAGAAGAMSAGARVGGRLPLSSSGGTGTGGGSGVVRLVLRSRQTGFGGGLPR